MRWKTKLVDALHRVPKIENSDQKSSAGVKLIKLSRHRLLRLRVKTPADTGDSIGVVFANGAIMDGEETQGNVGGDTTAAQIRDARLDPK